MKKAPFLVPPEHLWRHILQSEFLGPCAIHLGGGRVLLVVAGGRPPLAFDDQTPVSSAPLRCLSDDGGRTWRVLGQLPLEQIAGQPVGTSTVLSLGGNRLGFLNTRTLPNHHNGSVLAFAVSNDLGATFTSCTEIGGREEILYVMPERMIRLSTGRLLIPAALMPPEGKYEGDVNVGIAFCSDDQGRHWRRSTGAAAMPDGGHARGMAEPAVVEMRNGHLLMLARTGVGCHCVSYSMDGGDRWSTPERTTLTAACSPLSLKRLPDGRLIVFYNHAIPLAPGAFFPRTPLTYALSSDEGQSWSPPTVIDSDGVTGRDRQLIYPSVTCTDEGILVIYSVHAADPEGTFANGGPDGWKIGGGKRCVIPYAIQ